MHSKHAWWLVAFSLVVVGVWAMNEAQAVEPYPRVDQTEWSAIETEGFLRGQVELAAGVKAMRPVGTDVTATTMVADGVITNTDTVDNVCYYPTTRITGADGDCTANLIACETGLTGEYAVPIPPGASVRVKWVPWKITMCIRAPPSVTGGNVTYHYFSEAIP